MMNKQLREDVDWLINTSVDDMKSGLYNYGIDRLDVLRAAMKKCERRGEKTKAKVLASHIRKIKKEILALPSFRGTPMEDYLSKGDA